MTTTPDTSVAGTVALRPSATRVRRWAPRIVAFGEFIDGYDLLVIGAALLYLKPALHLTTGQVSLVTAAAFIGAAVGLLIFGDLTDRLGRRAIFLVNLVFFVVASITAAFVDSVWQLIAIRFLIGVAVGMDIPTSHAFLAEIAPRRSRGRIAGSLPNVMWLLGAITSVLLALALGPILGDDTWRWLFGLAAVPAALVLIARQFLPESPRWLLARGRDAEAARVIAEYGLETPTGTGDRREYRLLWRKPTRNRLLAITAFFALQAFGGAVATVANPLVLSSTGLGKEHTLQFSLIVYSVGLVAVLSGSLLIDRVDRRMYGVLACLGVFLAAIGIATAGRHSSAALIVFFALFSFLTWFGPGVLSWVWSAEAFPTAVRGLGSGVAQAAARLAIAANVSLVPALLPRWGLTTVGFYSVAYLAAAAIAAFTPSFATTGRELEATPS